MSVERTRGDGPRRQISSGTLIEAYRVEAPLGEGGMGTVYRATDTKLNRPVAIKLLSDEFADAAARRRFQREAQLASSLNHPHILTVYDVGEFDGRQYLVTEFVDGGTLKDWIKAEKRAPKQIVELLTGVADGLAAAHEAKITHRDIKPANILVAKNGYAKLADFGLAKAAETFDSESAATRTFTEGPTKPGVIVGTVAYMSPEQASGRKLDGRSDVFSFGIVLYEMLAGKRPFTGKSDLELLTTIIHGEPEPLPAETPVALSAIAEKALEKDPGDRYQSMREMVVDLRRAVHSKARGLPAEPERERRVSPWPWVLAAGSLAFATFLWFGPGREAPGNPLAGATFALLTDTEATELDAAISPDGRFVAYLSDRDGSFGVWLSQIGVGEARNITPPGYVPAPLRSLGFSHDGSEIWLAGTEEQKVRLLPLVGGQPRPFLGDSIVNPVWSPDGARMAYHKLGPGDPIFVADADGGNARQIHVDAPDLHNHYLTWGVEGEWIYYVHGIPATYEMDLWRIRASGGEPERLTYHNSDMRDPTPLGPGTLLYVARHSDGSGPWIWAYDLASKTSARATIGFEQYTSLTATAGGRRLAVTVANPQVDLWTVPIGDAVASEQDVRPVGLPSARAQMPRIREKTLYYLSSQGTGDGLWRFQDGKATEIWRGAQGALSEPPAVSPDGSRIAILIRKEGRRRLTLITSDGTDSRALAPEIDVQGSADWSPDGNWIVTGGNDGKEEGLFKIPASGGPAERILHTVARNPVWSPDGRWIAYAGPNIFTFSPLLVVSPDGSPLQVPQLRVHRDGERMRFLPDGRLVYMQPGGTAPVPWQDFWLLDLNTRSTRRLTELSGRAAMRAFDITADGREIVFDRTRQNSNIVLIDLPAKQ